MLLLLLVVVVMVMVMEDVTVVDVLIDKITVEG